MDRMYLYWNVLGIFYLQEFVVWFSCNSDSYFVQKRNSVNKLGLSSLQKIIVALRMLGYRVLGDLIDEYVWIRETTSLESLKEFVTVVIDVFSKEYLRKPNNEDIARLLCECVSFIVIWFELCM